MGLEDVGVRLVVEGDKQFASGMKAAQDANSGFSRSATETGTQSSKASGNVDKLTSSARDGATGFSKFQATTIALNQGLDLASRGFQILSDSLQKTVGYTIDYGEQVRTLSQLSGMSAEESSKVIRVADDLGISYDRLKTSIKTMAKEGIVPTIDQLATLSDQFLLIQDPAAQDAFLLKNLGKAGLDMVDMMMQGGPAIRAASDNMEKSLILTQADIDATHQAELEKRAFNDAIEAISISLGKFLMPAFTAVLEKGKDFVDWMGTVIDLAKVTVSSGPAMLAVLKAHSDAVVNDTNSYADYSKEMKRAAGLAGLVVMANGDIVNILGEVVIAQGAVNSAQYYAKKANVEGNASIRTLVASEEGWVSVNDRVAKSFDPIAMAAIASENEADHWVKAWNDAAKGAKDSLIQAGNDIKGAMTMFTSQQAGKKAIEDAQASVVSLTAEIQVLSKLRVLTPSQYAQVNTYWAALQQAKAATGEFADMTKTELSKAVDDLNGKIWYLTQGTYLTPDQKAQLETLKGELAGANSKVDEATKAYEAQEHQMVFNILMQAALARSGGTLTQTQIDNLGNLAISWGLMDNATLTAFKHLNDFDSYGIDTKLLSIEGELKSISDIAHDQSFNFHVNYTSSGSAFGGGGLAPTAEQIAAVKAAAAGGKVIVIPPSPGADYYWNGSAWVKNAKGSNSSGGQWKIGPGYENERYRFPDGRTASSGEVVTVTPAPASYSQVSAGPSSYNYSNSYAYNLSVMTSQSPGLVQHSFAMMQLMAGGR